MNTEIRELLEEARAAIDGRVRLDSPEYVALDALERALYALADLVHANEQATARAANVASCLANGIIPD